MTIFGSFFRPSTVDGIMAGFQRTIDQLDELIRERDVSRQCLYAQALEIDKRIEEAYAERMRADSIKLQLEKIVNPAKSDDEIPF
jgi:hypothetical protein